MYQSEKEPIIKAKFVRYNPASEDYEHPYIKRIQMKTPNVPDELETIFPSWTCRQAIFIEAGTGTGKSTFILKHLFPHVAEHGGRLLIVSNRIALNTQYKFQILQQANHPALKELTALGIQKAKEFEGLPVVFCSYQGLPGLLSERCGSFSYVVLDETHWWCADALFARDTGWLLEQIPKRFCDAVRIYMTATPWAVRNLIAEAEKEHPKPLLERMQNVFGSVIPSPGELYCHLLGFPYSPAAINASIPGDGTSLLYYSFPLPDRNFRFNALPAAVRDNPCNSTLLNLVQKSPANEKWIIFVNSKKQGTELAAALDGDYLDAESKSGALWESLTSKSRFSKRVLVTTPVLDCGVNILDSSVKHIILFSTEHVQFMQMLGRKRLQENEIVNVYVPDLSAQQIRRLVARNDVLLNELDRFKSMPEKRYKQRLNEWYDDNDELRKLIPIDGNGQLHVNRCAEQVVRQRDILFRKLEQMREEGHKHPFLEVAAGWMGLSNIDIEGAFCYAGKEELLKFLETNCEKPMDTKEAQIAFSQNFKQLRTATFGKRQIGNQGSREWGADIIRKELEALELPFDLNVIKGSWVLTKIDRSQEV